MGPSKSQKVICRICKKEVRKDHLETHQKQKHDSTLRKEAPPISSVFKRPEANTPHTAEEPLPTSLEQSSPNNREIGQQASSPLKRPRVSEDHATDSATVSEKASPTTLVTALQILSIITLLTNMSVAQTEMQTYLSNLPNLVAKAVCAQLEPASKTDASLLSVKQSVRRCYTIDEIIEKFHMKTFSADETFVCQVCFKHSANSPKQVIGAIGTVQGELKAILLDDPPVTEGHDGEGVATDIFQVLQKVYGFSVFQLRAQMTGLAFDGQYFGLDVPAILCEKTVNTLPWEVTERDAAFADQFDKVFTEQLEFKDKASAKVELRPEDFPLLCEHGKEISSKGTFMGVALKTAPAFGKDFKKAFNSVCTNRLAKWRDLVFEHFSQCFLQSEEVLVMESMVHWNAPAIHRTDNFIPAALDE
ncbi:hypothetical protein CYMTET_55632 [Cymbomonas tetramitiformis]|uniref:Uncharacterized protein n=1 Tax=Cymbomonas tetramitiformis TaxID=36881 RepID=A0AAE0BDY5_9CHLO|nr:hypothetical protein CYMTET_55632 [Cymbomonas tetramitiformis]